MQQDAVRKLGFTTDRTMRTAQQLYEGIDVGQGAIGLITYMRTDSVNLADEALTEIRHYIENKIGKEYLPSAAKQYKTKSKTPKKPTRPSVRRPCTERLKASNLPERRPVQTLSNDLAAHRCLRQVTPAKF